MIFRKTIMMAVRKIMMVKMIMIMNMINEAYSIPHWKVNLSDRAMLMSQNIFATFKLLLTYGISEMRFDSNIQLTVACRPG